MRQHTRNRGFMAIVLVFMFYLLYTHDRHDLDSDVHDRRPIEKDTRDLGDTNLPLIFIGGMPGSGTTLLRVMMDVHPNIRCGGETRIIPYILGMREKWVQPVEEKLKLDKAGVTSDVIDLAMASFIVEIIKGSGEPAPRLCNQDPLALKDADYLSKIFPNSKLVLMVRDGRAVCHSLITRGLAITGYNHSDVRDCLKRWDSEAEYLNAKCQHVGRKRCKVVRYEELVQYPEEWMRIILNFVNVPWNNAVLQHSFYVRNNRVHFSSNEKTAQLQKPINIAYLAKWVDHIPDSVRRDMDRIAPSLKRFGYDPKANPPAYKYDKPTKEFLSEY